MPARTARRPRRACLVAALAMFATSLGGGSAAAAPAAEQPSPPQYTLNQLEPLEGGTASFALGTSARGTAVGTSRTRSSFRPQLAVRWTAGQVENLGTLPGSTFSRAFAINHRGQAVGEAFTAPPETSRAVLWERDGTLRDLGTLGGRSAVANDIDDRGRAFGSSSRETGSSVATVWDRRGPRALPGVDPQATGPSRVNAVSAAGSAVGGSSARVDGGASVGQAVRWTPRGQDFLPTALDRLEPGRFATALGVTENGLVVGEAARTDPGTTRTSTRAVVWTGTSIQELTAVGNYRFTRATDASNSGDVVGFASGFAGFPTIDGAAVLWRGGQSFDLNEAIVDGPEGFVLRTAESINDRGDIVGFGTLKGQTHAFVLTPVSGR